MRGIPLVGFRVDLHESDVEAVAGMAFHEGQGGRVGMETMDASGRIVPNDKGMSSRFGFCDGIDEIRRKSPRGTLPDKGHQKQRPNQRTVPTIRRTSESPVFPEAASSISISASVSNSGSISR